MKAEDIYCHHHDRPGACLVCVLLFMKMCVGAYNNKIYKPIFHNDINESDIKIAENNKTD